MRVIPALDLRDGQVVRLEQGDYARETRYPTDALQQALRYQNAGAQCLHLVDLDAARRGGQDNLYLIRQLCDALSITVQTGGGVRSREDLRARLEAGATRVVVGSVCVRQPEEFCRWLEDFGPERLVAGLDVRQDAAGRWIPQAAGWTEAGGVELWPLLDRLVDAGLMHLLCTDISRDGMLAGAGVALYAQLKSCYPALDVQASGGIGSEADLHTVAATGVESCIVGRALLEGRVAPEVLATEFGAGR